jgi:hypothetical protein
VKTLFLLTELHAPAVSPAADLLQVDLDHWGIEPMFQQVTDVFHRPSLIRSNRRAKVFQVSLGLDFVTRSKLCMLLSPRAWIASRTRFHLSSCFAMFNVH